jgi:nucleoside-diphosphate-sugar epimerase
MPQRVLISGAQGFVGRYLVAHWLATHSDTTLVGIGRSPRSISQFTHAAHWGARPVRAPLPEALLSAADDSRYRYVMLDVLHAEALQALMREFRPEIVVHLVAALRDDPPEELFRKNVLGTIALLEGIASAGVGQARVVLGSSAAVYGDVAAEMLPIQEDMPRAPVDLYGVSKLAAEEAARVLSRRHGLLTIGARIFNPLGPGEDERHLGGSLGRQAAAIEAGELPPVFHVGPLDSTRDFIDVRDVARALELLSHHGVPGTVYNVATGKETRAETLLQIMLRLADLPDGTRVERQSPRPLDVPRHVADITRLGALGFEVTYPLEKSVKDILDYYRVQVRRAAADNYAV